MRSLIAALRMHLRLLQSRVAVERGDGPIQSAILASGVLALSMLLVQGGMFYHAHTIAANAAQVGVESSRLYNASGGAGESAARSYISTAGSGVFSSINVSSSRSTSTATVTVRARTTSLVPGVSMPQINVSAQAPVERLSSP